ncbi:MAG TPA: YceI family protein [Paracoccaceae bacterium]
MNLVQAARRPALMLALLVLLLPAAQAGWAAPSTYALEAETSVVGFETNFGKDRINGRMPVLRADLTLDFDNLARSSIAVTLDARKAVANFPFAAEAMKGPSVLNTSAFPQISFQSTAVRAEGDGARVEGNLTIRSVTRPVVLRANIWRQRGTAEGDLSHLTVRLTGAVNRSAFGAVGWLDMVSDEVRLDILARIARVN